MKAKLFFWPHWSKMGEDRSLTIKTTEYDEDQTHWTSSMTVSPSDPDYEFWCWLSSAGREPDVLSQSEVLELKQGFTRREQLEPSHV